ncbi:hypothetical protein LINGRAHAP2_LOCUS4262 [Linum grandiflorum]
MNTFHMPFGEMTVTLLDVWYILQVPICRTPLLADPDICSADRDHPDLSTVMRTTMTSSDVLYCVL